MSLCNKCKAECDHRNEIKDMTEEVIQVEVKECSNYTTKEKR